MVGLWRFRENNLDFLDDGLVDHVPPVRGEERDGGEKKQNVLVILPDTAERWGKPGQYKTSQL